MREERERERSRVRLVFILLTALLTGPSQTFSRVTSLPMTIPRWVPSFKRGRSGQGQDRRSDRMAGQWGSSAVGIASDLVLLIPRPETTENLLIRVRAGEMDSTLSEKSAKSSAKANGLTEGRRETKWRRG